MKRIIESAAAIAVIAAGLLYQGKIADPSAAQKKAERPAEEIRIVPVRVHLFRAESAPAVGVTLKSTDIDRIFRKANSIWHAAGIHLWVESIVEEEPVKVDDPHISSLRSVDELLPLRPIKSRNKEMFHVYYVGKMGVNGIFIGQDAVFVQQAANLLPVEGGIDEPLPRVTSHELGHGLGLNHRQERTNLMASGTTGTSLNDEEIATSRQTAFSSAWIFSPEAFLKQSELLADKGNKGDALKRALEFASLPGESPLKERAKRLVERCKKP